MIYFMRKKGRPKKLITCQWCRKSMGTAEFRAHFMACAHKRIKDKKKAR